MKRIITTLVVIITLIVNGYNQTQKPTFTSNQDLSFETFISGVKYAEIGINSLNQEQVDKQTGIAGFYYLAKKYLLDLGFEYVALTSSEKTELDISIKSYCDYVQVMFGGDINKNSIANMTITFLSCNGDVYSFTSDKKYNYGKFADVEKKLVEDWKSITASKGTYKEANRLRLPSNPTTWNKENILKYYKDNEGKLNSIEGIYERVRLSFEDITGGKYMVGVIKNPDEDGFLVIYLSGAKNDLDWRSGEIKAVLQKTATPGFYTLNWILRDKSLYDDVYCNLDPMGFNVYSSGIFPIAYKFIKISPVAE